MRTFEFVRMAGCLGFVLTTGCGAETPMRPSTPADVAAGSPLGPSYLLVPLPNDDDALLGRVLLDVPENGRSLEEVSRPNECADKLAAKKDGPLASTFEDGQELAAGGRARAALATFGFEGDAMTATHFYYKLDVDKRTAQADTTEYIACCKEKGTCGYGFVSALIHGRGEYATAAETSASGSVSIPIAGGAGGFVKAKILHRRVVSGYVAALVTVTDTKATKAVGVLGDPAAAGIQLTEQNLPEQVKARFEADRVDVVPTNGAPIETAYFFKDGHGTMTENEFVRRYHVVTGSDELDPVEHGRRKPFVIGGAIALAAGAAAMAIGTVVFFTAGSHGQSLDIDHNDQAAAGLGIAATGLGVAFFGGLSLGYGLLWRDGSSSSHEISKFDADLYAARYNRSLLRNTVRDTESRMRRLQSSARPILQPVVSPTFTGLMGVF